MSMPIVMVITLRAMDMPNITVILKTLWTIFENLCKKNLRNKVKKEWKKKRKWIHGYSFNEKPSDYSWFFDDSNRLSNSEFFERHKSAYICAYRDMTYIIISSSCKLYLQTFKILFEAYSIQKRYLLSIKIT